MSDVLIYAGTCPVCEGGLCRVRVCGVRARRLHGIVLCDECEATWQDPDLKAPHTFLNAENPESPVTGESIWDDENRWANMEDICLLGWYDRVIIESQNGEILHGPDSASLAASDSTYGQDEPKPGC